MIKCQHRVKQTKVSKWMSGYLVYKTRNIACSRCWHCNPIWVIYNVQLGQTSVRIDEIAWCGVNTRSPILQNSLQNSSKPLTLVFSLNHFHSVVSMVHMTNSRSSRDTRLVDSFWEKIIFLHSLYDRWHHCFWCLGMVWYHTSWSPTYKHLG